MEGMDKVGPEVIQEPGKAALGFERIYQFSNTESPFENISVKIIRRFSKISRIATGKVIGMAAGKISNLVSVSLEDTAGFKKENLSAAPSIKEFMRQDYSHTNVTDLNY